MHNSTRTIGFILMVTIMGLMTGCAHIFSPPKHAPKKPPAAVTVPARPSKPAPVTVIPPARPPVTDIKPSVPDVPPAERDAALAKLIETCTLLPAKPIHTIVGSSYYRRYAGNVGKTAVYRLISTKDLSTCYAYTEESTTATDTGATDIIDVLGL